MKESKLFNGLLATIVIVALGAPAYASADAGAVKERTVKVSYADLNLEKVEGAEVLYRRLQQASKKACGLRSIAEEGTLRSYSEGRQCYHKALSEAVAKIDNRLLTEIHTS
ncbi:MAG: UrcA family protein [Woeseiaceae bacterium]|nr:UrcA family protein [Woeseiaceae bacterium]